MHARVARAVNARPTVQRVHDESGIVRHHGAFRLIHQRPRLNHGVLGERRARLLRVLGNAGLRHAHHVEAVAQQRLHFLELAKVARRDDQPRLLSDDLGFLAQRGQLLLHQRFHALLAQREQPGKLFFVKRASLAGALHFNIAHFAVRFARHDHVHVHLRAGILHVFQIQRRHVVHDAHAHGRHLPHDGRIHNQPALHQLVARQRQRRERARDGRGARAAVGLKHVAVDVNRSLAQSGQIARGAKRTADQPLNLHAAPILLDAVAFLAALGGAGQHGVLRRQPSAASALLKRRHAFHHRGRAQHTRAPALDQHGARRHFGKIRGHLYRTHLVRPSYVFHRDLLSALIPRQTVRPTACERTLPQCPLHCLQTSAWPAYPRRDHTACPRRESARPSRRQSFCM